MREQFDRYLQPRMRINFFVGTRLAYKPVNSKVDQIGFFLKLNTNELYTVSAIQNDYLDIDDIFKLGLGLFVRW